MRRASRVRYQLFLPKPLSERFERLAAAPGASKSSILAAALTAFLERRGASELDERFQERLDRLSAQLARIERDGHVQIETLALFIRYMLVVNAPLPEEDETARAIRARPFRSLRRSGRAATRRRPPDLRRRRVNAAETALRKRAMLDSALGPVIAQALADPLVIEVLVNPDGAVRVDRLGEGCSDTGARIASAEAERIIRLVASHVRAEAHRDAPVVSAELPPHGTSAGERFEGILPPVSTAPCFAIRKPAERVYSLADYVADAIMSADVARQLSLAVVERRNILVAGGTSSGKTTLANALLAELAGRRERVILIEDTRELQCAAPDSVALRTRAGLVGMADLVRSTLRLRPDRIIVGEVRGAEALDMLKAWNTGHPGGIATVHANSARSALYRLEQLVQEAVVNVPRRLIAEAIDLIVFIEGRGLERRIGELALVDGVSASGDYALRDASEVTTRGE